MSEKLKLPLIEQLPGQLGLAERFGRAALSQVIIEPDSGTPLFPELARVYELLPGELGG